MQEIKSTKKTVHPTSNRRIVLPRASDSILHERVENVANEADQQAEAHRKWYWRIKVLQLGLAFCITADLALTHAPLTLLGTTIIFSAKSPAMLGGLLVALEALQQAGQFHTHWLNFRMCKERLLTEWFLFLSKASPYDDALCTQKLSSNIEAIVRDTNLTWSKTETQAQEAKSGTKIDYITGAPPGSDEIPRVKNQNTNPVKTDSTVIPTETIAENKAANIQNTEFQPTEGLETANRNNIQITELWGAEYKRCRNVFLAHTIKPSRMSGMKYDIYIYLVGEEDPSEGNDLALVTEAFFYLGPDWGKKPFHCTKDKDLKIGILTSAYGPVLCTASVRFKDNTEIVLERWIDFEMGYVFENKII